MTSTSITKAASNGKTEPTQAPERKTGMSYVTESVAYHMASIAHDAAFEAERLCNDVYRAVSDAYLREGRKVSEAAETANSDEITEKVNDAVRCLYAAETYLRYLRADEQPF